MIRWIAPLASLALGAGTSLAAQVPVSAPDTARKSLPAPVENAALAADAESRMALFDLLSGRPLAAVTRLERIQSASIATSTPMASEARFLLAEAYYRLGMSAPFRSAATEVLAGGTAPARYAAVLRSQLLLDAYRNGDDARAAELAGSAGVGGEPGLTSFVLGLVRYRTKDYAAARQAFALARQTGGVYAPYAQYMDALAVLNGDTAQASAALEALRALAATATGPFADQVRLTAAQIAYGSGQLDQAVTLSSNVASSAALGAEASFTHAWSQYKAGQFDAAATSFADFAKRFPHLAQRDEARLMSGQAMLESGRADDAARHFRAVADSMTAETAALQSRAAMTETARALVAARVTGVLFLGDALNGKALVLPDAAGADYAVLLRAFADSAGGAPESGLAAPMIVSLADVDAQLHGVPDSVTSGLARRVLYVPAQPASIATFADRSQALVAADVRVAIAKYKLQLITDDNAQRTAELRGLQGQLSSDSAGLATVSTQLATEADSVSRLSALIDASKVRVRQLVAAQVEATRQLAAENTAGIDSARATAGANGAPIESGLLTTENQTAALYRDLADVVGGSLDGLIARIPAFALRDSLKLRLDRARTTLADAQAIVHTTSQSIVGELARLMASDAYRVAQAELTAAEAQRTGAEAQMVSLLEADFRARAAQLVALLQHDTEAAEYGSASASFFRAIDAGRTEPGTAAPARPTPPDAAERTTPVPAAGKPTPPRQ